mgnify:FL=1
MDEMDNLVRAEDKARNAQYVLTELGISLETGIFVKDKAHLKELKVEGSNALRDFLGVLNNKIFDNEFTIEVGWEVQHELMEYYERAEYITFPEHSRVGKVKVIAGAFLQHFENVMNYSLDNFDAVVCDGKVKFEPTYEEDLLAYATAVRIHIGGLIDDLTNKVSDYNRGTAEDYASNTAMGIF